MYQASVVRLQECYKLEKQFLFIKLCTMRDAPFQIPGQNPGSKLSKGSRNTKAKSLSSHI